MNYRHGYHAGNFADVFKHLVLISLLQSLLRKNKPFFYLDTHAGRGQYELFSEMAQKTFEAQNGIIKLMAGDMNDMPATVKVYIDILKNSGYPDIYPGSPLVANAFLRETDRMGLIELQEDEAFFLKNLFKGEKRVAVHQQNGYQGIKALLPPLERRGLILIDPPFEKENEWDEILNALQIACKRFSTGIYAIWYPIKALNRVKKFLQSEILHGLSNVLSVEFCIYPEDTPLTLAGSGMLIINAPWQLDAELNAWLPWVWNKLAHTGAKKPALNWL